MSLLFAVYLSGLIGSNLGAVALLLTPKNLLVMSFIQAIFLATIFGLFLSTIFYVGVAGFEIEFSIILGFGAFCFGAIYRYLNKPEKLLNMRHHV